MTPPLVADRSTQKPVGFRVARLALLGLALLNVIWAAFGVRTVAEGRYGRGFDFAWGVVAEPALFATLAAVAMWWLREERAAGAILGSVLVLFHGLRMVLQALALEGGPNIFAVALGMFLIGCATSLGLAGRTFKALEKTKGPLA